MTQTFDPSVTVAPVIYPRPVAGFRRLVQVSHPMFGSGTLLSTDASLNDSGNPNYTKYAFSPGVDPNTNYAFTPGVGHRQKAIHSAGTREVTWNIAGEVTSGSLGLLELLTGSARGVNFSRLLISQGNSSFLFDNQDGNSLPWNQFSLSGNPNAGLTFSLEGKATVDPFLGAAVIAPIVVTPPVPTWTTGNDLVLSWSLSHNVNLQPFWFNDPKQWLLSKGIATNVNIMLPSYYRALDSEFTLQITTAVALAEYTLIRIGYGYINFVELILTTENITFGDRNSPVTYQASSTNVAVASQASAYTEYVNIILGGVPDAGYG